MANEVFRIFLTGIHKQTERNISGEVTDPIGIGLMNVGIYHQDRLLAVTATEYGDYSAKILSGSPYTITPRKEGYYFLPQAIEIPADDFDYVNVNFTGYSSPGPVTLLSPSGTIYSSTPTYKWIASSYASRFKLLVQDSTGTVKINTVYTESEAGCASGSANCSVTPSTSLADGSWSWSVQACKSDLKDCGEYSKPMGFIVSAGPQDPILGLWDAGDGGRALMEESTTGGYKFVATITVQGTGWWKQRNINVGQVAWRFNKQPDGHYKGESAVNGNYSYWWPMEVVLQGNQMIDTASKLIGTKIQ
jgi:hypothetical protein